jgi:vacuolar-type H+-ATPase subunit I/STV1
VLTLAPLLKVSVYVPRSYLERTLFDIGREGLLHLTDVKEDFPEEVVKGLLRPIDVSTRLYRISLLSSKVEKITSTLKLAPKYSLEDLKEEEVLSFSIPDAEAYIDSLEKSLSSADESIVEKVKEEHGEKVLKLGALLRVLEALESAKTKTAETATVAVFSGWLPKELLNTFVDVVRRASDGFFAIKCEEPKPRLEAHAPREEVEEGKREVVNLRFYVLKEYVDPVLYALSRVEHSFVDLRSALYAELEEEAKPFEPPPRLFKLSSLSSRLDVILNTLGIRPPGEAEPLGEPLSDERLSEIDSIVSSIEKEVFALSSKLESLKRSMEVASRLESDVSAMVVPRLAEVAVQDVRGTIRSIVLQLSDEAGRIHTQLDKIRSESESQLVEFKRVVEGARLVEEKKLKMLATDNTAILQIAVAKEDVERAISLVREASKNNFTCREVGRPTKVKAKKEVKVEALREVRVPSLMRNPSWARVYEGLVKGLGALNYREIDPTIIWFFTFPIFFGIMFPDVGHGLVLLALSIPLYYLKRKGYRGGEISNYIVQGAPVLVACAITSTIFGVIFGEFFGNPASEHHPFFKLGINPFSGAVAQFRESALSVLGLPREFHVLEASGATALLKLTIYIAIFHITLGLLFSVINKVRLGEYKEAIVGPGLWLWLYLGAGTAFIIYRSKLIAAALGGDMLVFVLIWLPFIVMFIARVIFMGFLDGFGESLDHFIASLSNTISYARLFAFAIVHAVLSDVFLAVDHGLCAMIGVPFIGAVAGTLFFVFFEIVFVFFQALRLHWVEHGTKFLIADGVPFQPFTIKL